MALALWALCAEACWKMKTNISTKLVSGRKHGALLVDGCVDCGYSGPSTGKVTRRPKSSVTMLCLLAAWVLYLGSLFQHLGDLNFQMEPPTFGATLVLFLLGPSATLLVPSLPREGLDTRNVSPVAHFLDMPRAWWLFMHWPQAQSSLCEALPSS